MGYVINNDETKAIKKIIKKFSGNQIDPTNQKLRGSFKIQKENNVANNGLNMTNVVLSPTGRHSTLKKANITPPNPKNERKINIYVVHQLLPNIGIIGLLLFLLLLLYLIILSDNTNCNNPL